MKYLLLVYQDRENWDACPDQDCFDYAAHVAQSGKMVAAEPLYPVETATTVRVRNGEVLRTDGPFAETKEMLAGFYLVDADNEEEALKIAEGVPPAKYGSVEVRPVRQLNVPANIPG